MMVPIVALLSASRRAEPTPSEGAYFQGVSMILPRAFYLAVARPDQRAVAPRVTTDSPLPPSAAQPPRLADSLGLRHAGRLVARRPAGRHQTERRANRLRDAGGGAQANDERPAFVPPPPPLDDDEPPDDEPPLPASPIASPTKRAPPPPVVDPAALAEKDRRRMAAARTKADKAAQLEAARAKQREDIVAARERREADRARAAEAIVAERRKELELAFTRAAAELAPGPVELPPPAAPPVRRRARKAPTSLLADETVELITRFCSSPPAKRSKA